jgi:hypothetical protein
MCNRTKQHESFIKEHKKKQQQQQQKEKRFNYIKLGREKK